MENENIAQEIHIGGYKTQGFTIFEFGGCRLVRGMIPCASFGILIHGMPKNTIFSPDLARILGVNFAVGRPEDVQRILSDKEVQKTALLQVHAQLYGLNLPAEAVEWWALGEHGSSSEAIFIHLSGLRLSPDQDSKEHPHDPSDLRRCRLLLEAVPSFRERLPEMSEVSREWGQLVAKWDQLCTMMDEECPQWRKGKKGDANKTYMLMRELLCE